ncbi:nucleoside hydrolase [Gilvibacter sp.]|uniref:nucleoside hydrolase n=1 Tax=Gilvibacter sp. TaxID=2729997 RepID=UPI003F4A7014
MRTENKIVVWILNVLLVCFITGCKQEANPKVQLIFDTDFGGDADDLGALAMLNHFHNKQEAELMAVMCWNLEQFAVPAIDAVNTYYGNPDIPIGLRAGDFHRTPWQHTKVLADSLPHDAAAANMPEATALYRELLSKSDDQSVIIITVGPLANIMNLMQSEPDAYSEMNGMQLIEAKVKEFVIMGGNFPTSKDEWNFNGNIPGVTKFVLDNLTTTVTFSGAELGAEIRTGTVFNDLPKDSPLYLGFYHFSQYAPWMNHQFEGAIFDNATFDQTAVLYAVRGGVGEYWDRVVGGKCMADNSGGNTWVDSADSNQSYLKLKMPLTEVESQFERFMLGDF